MYCHKCGKEIDDEAVVCTYCGVATKNLDENNKDKQINIVNQSSSSSTAVARVPRVHNGFFDFFMILMTGGLWIIWMIIRPKYY